MKNLKRALSFVTPPLLIYCLGFLVWSLHAFRNGMGFLPINHIRYVVAGIIPAATLAGSWVLAIGLKKFLVEFWPGYINSTKPLARFVRVLLNFSLTACIICLVVVLTIQRFFPGTDVFFAGIKRGILYTMIIPMIFRPQKDLLGRVQRWLWVSYGVITFSVLALVGYVFYLYPLVPQEFGGVRPYCVRLELEKENLSHQTALRIIQPREMDSREKTVETIALNMFYLDDNVAVLKPVESAKNSVPVIISRNVISLIHRCKKKH